jgi:iron complex transport system ATP-binding protein
VALARLFRRLAAERIVVTVLHDLPVALRADRVLVLQQGRSIATGRPQERALQQALEAVFEHAIRIGGAGGGGVLATLNLDGD